MATDPAYVDTHRVRVTAPRDDVWRALRGFIDGSLTSSDGLLRTLLGTEPPAGFAVTGEVPGERIELSGRHRFSVYRLVFEVGAGELRAVTFADFPGLRGQAYKTLVIRSRLHVLATRRMLEAVRRRAEAQL